jgi:thiamine biosynthesis lipoprotein
MTRRRLERERFRALGTWCSLGVSAGSADGRWARRALAAAHDEVVACERDLSRFDPVSDLSRLNAAAGSRLWCGRRLLDALDAALQARAETEGLYEPAILDAVVAAGYDRSFELLEAHAPQRPVGWRRGGGVELDRDAGTARLAPGAAVDLGGIGKGFAAERALDAMLEAWPEAPGVLADIGGDIAVRGLAPEGAGWLLRVADPLDGRRSLGTLVLGSGGVATSGTGVRQLGRDGGVAHVVDPRSGLPVPDPPLAVTVVSSDAMRAEAHATALSVLARAGAAAYVESRPGLAALLVERDGTTVQLGRLPLAERQRLTVSLRSAAR